MRLPKLTGPVETSEQRASREAQQAADMQAFRAAALERSERYDRLDTRSSEQRAADRQRSITSYEADLRRTDPALAEEIYGGSDQSNEIYGDES
jgi:hypothetical protein